MQNNENAGQQKLLQEKPVKTSSAIWLAAGNGFNGLLAAFAEGSAVTYFYEIKLGLNYHLGSIVLIIFGIWNAINDPIYGFLADHTHSKLGRRRPWIRYGAPFLALFNGLMWINWPNEIGNQGFLFAMMLSTLLLYDVFYTAVASAIYVMPYELAVTNKARNKVFLWTIVFSLIQYIVPAVVGMKFDQIMSNLTAFAWGMAILGIVVAAIIFASTFFYKENGYTQKEEQPKFFEGLKMCVKNKPFMLFEVMSWTVIYALGGLTLGLTPLTSMWASGFENSAGEVINPEALSYVQQYGWLGNSSILVLAAALIVGLVGGLILFILTVQKWGTRTDCLITCGVMGVGTMVGSFLGMYFWVMVFAAFAIGVGMAGGIYLVPFVNGDVIDYDEILSGKRREGTYAGINSLFTKIAQSIAQAVFWPMMAAFGFDRGEMTAQGYVTDYASQTSGAKNHLFFCWFFILACLLVISFIAMWFYPLHGEKWNSEKAKLAEIHKKKEQDYEQKVLAKIQGSAANQ